MEFRILDENFIDVDVVDVFSSFIWTDRYSAFGDFDMATAPSPHNLASLKPDRYIWSLESDRLMIIEDIRITTDIESENQLIITGRSLESILERRIIWVQTQLSGNFQNGIKKLLDDAIINPTDPTRRIDNFIFQPSTDPAITSLTISVQFTGTNLYEAIKGLCDDRNIGFKITLSSDNEFVFSLYAGVDRSYAQFTNPYVIFSPEFDNLLNSNYFYSKANLKTVTLSAGEGEGLERRTVEVAIESGAESGLSRREMYTDARDISSNNGEILDQDYEDQLAQRGRNYLAENVIIKAFEGNVDTSNMYIFGKDFFMGDIIQIVNEFGIESTSRITEIVRSQNEEGIQVFPTFVTIE